MDSLVKSAREIIDPLKIDVIFYHFPCVDGMTSAYIAWKYYKDKEHKPMLVGLSYSSKNKIDIDLVKGRNVVMFDIAPSKSTVVSIKEAAQNLVILDHHQTAYDNLNGVDGCFIDNTNKRSGAGLAWEYFFGDTPLPTFVFHVQRRDTWNFDHPDTKPFSIVFNSIDMSFEEYDKYLDEELVTQTIKDGNDVLGFLQGVMEEASSESYDDLLDGAVVTVIAYCVFTSILSKRVDESGSDLYHRVFQKCDFLVSDLGEYLYKNFVCDAAAILHTGKDDSTIVSLRSDSNVCDVQKIAAKYGGGGHKGSAGFVCNRSIEGLYASGF